MHADSEIGHDKENQTSLDGLSDYERKVWTLEGFDELPICLSVEAAAQMLGVSRSMGYECVTDGTLGAIRIRRRLLVPRHELFRMLFQFRPPSAPV